MSTIQKERNLLAGLFGKTRRSILGLLFTHPGESFYLRQILRMIGVAPGAGQRELKWLTDYGIIRRTIRGNQVYYQADMECSIFPELQSLMTKTVGIGDILKSMLAPLADRIRVVLIHGSLARGKVKKDSDIDLLVVGEVSFAEIVEKLSPAQEILKREINPSVFPSVEFQKNVSNGHHFLNSILNEDYIILIGDENELRRLVKKRMAD